MKFTKIAQQLGSRGGKKSAESRLGGMTKEQRSEAMRNVRKGKDPVLQAFHEAFMESLTKNQNDQF